MSDREEPRYPEVVVDVPPDAVDEVSAELFELGASGVEERDGTTLLKAAVAGRVTLVASFPTHEEAALAVGSLHRDWSPRVHEVVGDAWRDEWKKHFHPFELCAGIVVVPPWERYEPRAGQTILELEPGRAFGTGLHETTSLVAEELAGTEGTLAGKQVLDVGCGSGILALVALRLGARAVRAIDIDPEAVAVTRENAARNAFSDQITTDTTPVEEVEGAFDVVVANIEAKVLSQMALALVRRVAPGGVLILSGILATQVTEVERAFAGLSFVTRHKGEWTVLAARR